MQGQAENKGMLAAQRVQLPAGGVSAYLFAALMTGLIFVGLPFLEKMARPPENRRIFRTIDTITLQSLPPPPSPPRVEEPLQNPPPKPRLVEPVQPLRPLPMNVDVPMMPSDVGGDFTLNFGVQRDALARQLDELVFEVGELDEAPRAQVRMQPVYPPRARMRRQEGVVELEFVVGPSGEVGDIEIISSRPPQTFDQAAVRAVSGWRFTPGMKGGQPVATRVRQKISFTLE
jgi:protein TonB